MTRFNHIDRRSLMAVYVLAAFAVLTVLMIMGQVVVGIFLVLVASIMAALLYRSAGSATVAAPRASTMHNPRPWTYDPNEPVLLTSVVASDGEIHTARVIPMEQNAGHRLLLTREGYLLTDAEGRVFHRFGPDSQ